MEINYRNKYKRVIVIKIRRTVRIIIVFTAFLLLLAVLVSVCRHIADKEKDINNTIDYFGKFTAFILGYGDPIQNNLFLVNFFALIGVISLGYFTSFLTVNLFWRIKDVYISKTMAIWERNGRYFASILLGNKGEDICKIDISLSAYDPIGKYVMECGEKQSFPLLVKNSVWKFDFPIDQTEINMKKALRQIHTIQTGQELIAVISYVDTKTGQESIRLIKYGENSIYATKNKNGFAVGPSRKNVFKQFKSITADKEKHDMYLVWLKGEAFQIGLDDLKPINAGTIKIHERESGTSLSASINFEIPNDLNEIPPFVMLYFDYNHHPIDWSKYYDDDVSIKITLSGSPDIQRLWVQVKTTKGKESCAEIRVTESVNTTDIRIRDLFEDSKDLSCVREFCITIYKEFLVSSTAVLFIEKIELVYPVT